MVTPQRFSKFNKPTWSAVFSVAKRGMVWVLTGTILISAYSTFFSPTIVLADDPDLTISIQDSITTTVSSLGTVYVANPDTVQNGGSTAGARPYSTFAPTNFKLDSFSVNNDQTTKVNFTWDKPASTNPILSIKQAVSGSGGQQIQATNTCSFNAYMLGLQPTTDSSGAFNAYGAPQSAFTTPSPGSATIEKQQASTGNAFHFYPYRIYAVYDCKGTSGQTLHVAFQDGTISVPVNSSGVVVSDPNHTLDQSAEANAPILDACTAANQTGAWVSSFGGAAVVSAVCGVIHFIGDTLQNTMAFAMTFALNGALGQIQVVKDLNFANSGTPVPWAVTLYQISLNLVNYLVVLVLLFLSFVNILHINIDTYAIKKIMPTIIVGVLLANFSLLITRFVVDASEVLTFALVGSPTTFAHDFVASFAGGVFLTGTAAVGLTGVISAFAFSGVGLPVAFGFLCLLLIPFAIVFILLLLFWLRYYVIVMLAALSPLAFAALATPMTQQYFKQWWSNLLKWAFMAPIAFFFLNIAGQVGKALPGGTTTNGRFSTMVLATLMAYLAVTIPWKLGGAVAATWSGALKKVGAYTGKTADKWLGDIQEGTGRARSTPLTFLAGWKERTDEQYHHHETVAKATGKAAREATSRGVAQIMKGNFGGAMQAAHGGFDNQMARSQGDMTTQMREQFESTVEANVGKNEEDIQRDVTAALAGTDMEQANRQVLIAARNGQLTAEQRDQHIQNLMDQNPRMAAAVDSLIAQYNQRAELPAHTLGTAVTQRNGEYIMKDDGQRFTDDQRAKVRRWSSKNTNVAASEIRREAQALVQDRNGQAISPDQWNAEQRATFQAIRQMSPAHQAGIAGSPELDRLQLHLTSDDLEARLDPNDLAAIGQPVARNFTEELRRNAGFAPTLPTRTEDITEQHRDLARALGDNDTFDRVRTTFTRQQNRLQQELDRVFRNSGINLSNIETPDAPNLSAADHARIEQQRAQIRQNPNAQHILVQNDAIMRSLRATQNARDLNRLTPAQQPGLFGRLVRGGQNPPQVPPVAPTPPNPIP